jgi:hypothetical protein
MSSNSHKHLLTLQEDYSRWHCNLYFNDIQTDGTRLCYDLCQSLEYSYPFEFPDRFRGPSAKDLLVLELKLGALCCGYSLNIRSSNHTLRKGSQQQIRITLSCEQGTMHRERLSKIQHDYSDNSTVTSNPVSKSIDCKPPVLARPKRGVRLPTTTEHLCDFSISIYMHKEDGSLG